MQLISKMKPLFIFAVIAGLVILCGVSGVPCFADSGSGVSIELTTTVTGGDGSGWHDWGSGSGSYYVPPAPKRNASPTLPTTQPNTPPTMPTPPTYPNTNPPQVTPVQGIPMPTESSVNFGTILTGIGIVLASLIAWYLWTKRKPKKIQQPIGISNEEENKDQSSHPS